MRCHQVIGPVELGLVVGLPRHLAERHSPAPGADNLVDREVRRTSPTLVILSRSAWATKITSASGQAFMAAITPPGRGGEQVRHLPGAKPDPNDPRAPAASETGDTGRKGEPMTKAGPSLGRATMIRAVSRPGHACGRVAAHRARRRRSWRWCNGFGQRLTSVGGRSSRLRWRPGRPCGSSSARRR
jgi:hypothetical protein